MLALQPFRTLLSRFDQTENIQRPAIERSTCKNAYIQKTLPDSKRTGLSAWLSLLKLNIEEPWRFVKLPRKHILSASLSGRLARSITIRQQLVALIWDVNSLTDPRQLQVLEYTAGQFTRRKLHTCS